MEKFTPYEKMSKKAKRELNRTRRGSWGAISPVTRRVPNAKVYNRKKIRQEEKLFDAGSFFIIPSKITGREETECFGLANFQS